MTIYKKIVKAIEQELEGYDKSKYIIESKSHQHLKLNSNVIPEFNKFHEQTCGDKIRKTEKGIFCDANGNRIYLIRNGKKVDGIQGTRKKVTIDWNEMWHYYQKYGELHFTHNHPRESGYPSDCLSAGDVECLFSSYDRSGLWDGTPDLVYPLKSVSCESPLGQRMTLVRGDKFKYDNRDSAIQLGKKLQTSWRQYVKRYWDVKWETFRMMENNEKYVGKSQEELHEIIVNTALKEVGRFEQTPEFKEIRKQFREIDCKLMMSYPSEYKVNNGL